MRRWVSDRGCEVKCGDLYQSDSEETVFILLCKPGQEQWWSSACVIHLPVWMQRVWVCCARPLWDWPPVSAFGRSSRQYPLIVEAVLQNYPCLKISLQQHRKMSLDLSLDSFDNKSPGGFGKSPDLARKSLNWQHWNPYFHRKTTILIQDTWYTW